MKSQHVDVAIIGAGLSGISAAYHLQKRCPGKSYRIIESRSAIGGTWDLFRYPGIRSDSDMFSFGFGFKPWTNGKIIAPGEDILEYIREAADENGINEHIQFGHKVIAADWDSDTGLWTCQLQQVETGEKGLLTCKFFFACTGYYRYAQGYTPEFSGIEDFQGPVVHPQQWPEGLNVEGKRVTIIGSGATAVTLAPTLAKAGATVTLLQRSPTYIVSQPDSDKQAKFWRRVLPAKMAHGANRWRHILRQMFFYQMSKRRPEMIKKLLVKGVKYQLGKNYDVEKHFVPSYKPWDQRVCLVPNGDFFRAIRKGSVTMVTEQIDRLDATGIQLKSGERLEADIVITATGLVMELLSGVRLSVDGVEKSPSDGFSYKGMMLSSMPNFALTSGYTNASWTLKAELVAKYVCRLIQHMDAKGYDYCMPVMPQEGLVEDSVLPLSSGYVQRAQGGLPKQAGVAPWKLYQNYILDRIALATGSVVDSNIEFGHCDEAVGMQAVA